MYLNDEDTTCGRLKSYLAQGGREGGQELLRKL